LIMFGDINVGDKFLGFRSKEECVKVYPFINNGHVYNAIRKSGNLSLFSDTAFVLPYSATSAPDELTQIKDRIEYLAQDLKEIDVATNDRLNELERKMDKFKEI